MRRIYQNRIQEFDKVSFLGSPNSTQILLVDSQSPVGFCDVAISCVYDNLFTTVLHGFTAMPFDTTEFDPEC